MKLTNAQIVLKLLGSNFLSCTKYFISFASSSFYPSDSYQSDNYIVFFVFFFLKYRGSKCCVDKTQSHVVCWQIGSMCVVWHACRWAGCRQGMSRTFPQESGWAEQQNSRICHCEDSGTIHLQQYALWVLLAWQSRSAWLECLPGAGLVVFGPSVSMGEVCPRAKCGHSAPTEWQILHGQRIMLGAFTAAAWVWFPAREETFCSGYQHQILPVLLGIFELSLNLSSQAHTCMLVLMQHPLTGKNTRYKHIHTQSHMDTCLLIETRPMYCISLLASKP